MNREIRYTWSPRLARSIYLSTLWHQWGGLLIGSLLAAGFLLLLLRHPDNRIPASFGLGFLVAFWLLWWYGWLVAPRASGRREGDRESVITVLDEGLRFTLPGVEVMLHWSAVSEVHRLRRIWLLFASGSAGPTVIPATVLDDEVRAFIEDKVRGGGGRLR